MKYKFDCGCEFDITNSDIKENDGLPSIYIDYENIPENCPATWQLIQSGQTKGVFQLEANLGRHWAKTLIPTSLTEMSALVSLIRPGCLRAIVDGKSMTQHYCDRKNSGDEVKYFHQALEPILQETYGVLTYQEESMRIAQDIAGFNLQEADVLRKAIGKKKADIMAKVKKDFIEGCKKTGIVSEEEAEEIFGWIQESQRYSFNKCLDPTTIVETKDGYKTIEELQKGEFIKAPDNDLNHTEYVEVVDKIDQGKQDIYEIILESGVTIKCTLNHKFLCEDGKIRPLFKILEKNLEICIEDGV